MQNLQLHDIAFPMKSYVVLRMYFYTGYVFYTGVMHFYHTGYSFRDLFEKEEMVRDIG